ncbi:MAG: hypothetical protein HY645_14535 [Acidobacteria bacterium]|nr:hypothetical protein [Acidobacteriota bacterium]
MDSRRIEEKENDTAHTVPGGQIIVKLSPETLLRVCLKVMNVRRLVFPLLVLCCHTAATASQVNKESNQAAGWSEQKPAWEWRWLGGLQGTFPGKNFEFLLSGRMHYDWLLSGNESGDGSSAPEGELRRALLGLTGQIHQFEFKIEYDFGNALIRPKDVFVGMRGIPWLGTVRVGHLREPFGLDVLGSSSELIFMERGLPSAFSTSRSVGALFQNSRSNLHWAAGVFRETADSGAISRHGYHLTARVAGLLTFGESPPSLLHLGASFSHREPGEKSLRFRQRPEAHLAPVLMDSGFFKADSIQLYGLEASAQVTKAHLQSESICAVVQMTGRQQGSCGLYALASYVFNGERRPYQVSSGVFGRVRSGSNILAEGNRLGAWEVAVRFSRLALETSSLRDSLRTLTLGVNWYPHAYLRVMVNHVLAKAPSDRDMQLVQLRLQIYF